MKLRPMRDNDGDGASLPLPPGDGIAMEGSLDQAAERPAGMDSATVLYRLSRFASRCADCGVVALAASSGD